MVSNFANLSERALIWQRNHSDLQTVRVWLDRIGVAGQPLAPSGTEGIPDTSAGLAAPRS